MDLSSWLKLCFSTFDFTFVLSIYFLFIIIICYTFWFYGFGSHFWNFPTRCHALYFFEHSWTNFLRGSTWLFPIVWKLLGYINCFHFERLGGAWSEFVFEPVGRCYLTPHAWTNSICFQLNFAIFQDMLSSPAGFVLCDVTSFSGDFGPCFDFHGFWCLCYWNFEIFFRFVSRVAHFENYFVSDLVELVSNPCHLVAMSSLTWDWSVSSLSSSFSRHCSFYGKIHHDWKCQLLPEGNCCWSPEVFFWGLNCTRCLGRSWDSAALGFSKMASIREGMRFDSSSRHYFGCFRWNFFSVHNLIW